MTQVSPKTYYLADYTPPSFFIDTIVLTVELMLDKTRVTSVLTCRRNTKNASSDLVLDGDELVFLSAALDGLPLSASHYSVTDAGLTIHDVPDVFSLEIVSECFPKQNTKLSGLYCSNGLYCTQCEPHGFRRITYYIDSPDLLATFTTKIIADQKSYPVLLSNGNCIERGDLPGGRHYAIWSDPFKKPAYLFALVAGDLAYHEDSFRTMDGRDIALRIYVAAHQLSKVPHAMWSLKEAMRWDEQYYGRIYDLDVFMIVAVRDFNFGAMENKGLNIFNEKYILADPQTATDQDYMNIARVVAHEYFHNWSGNRVTCRDWFQLSLKEGLTVFRDQSFSETYFGQAISRIGEVNLLRSAQFAEDAGPLAHPVRPSSYVEVNNFYTLTVYEKGAELIRMQKQLLGEVDYRRATDLYFSRFDGQAVTCDDFVGCMAETAGQDLSQFKRWYDQAGTPTITMNTHYHEDSKQYAMTFTQMSPNLPGNDKDAVFMIPVRISLFDQQGKALPLQLVNEAKSAGDERVLTLSKSTQTFRFANMPAHVVPSVLRGFSAPVKLQFDYNRQDLAFLMQHETDGVNRWEASFQYANLQLQVLLENPKAPLDERYLETVLALLEQRDIDKRLLAAMITPPSLSYLAEQMPIMAVERLCEAHHAFRCALARHCEAALISYIDEAQLRSPYQFEQTAMGIRAMRFAALDLLSSLSSDSFFNQCEKWYQLGGNMTDQFNLLSALNHTTHPIRARLMQTFYDCYSADALVMDKWLRLQASANLPDTVERVTDLLKQSVFDIKNPNKVFALLGAFGANLSQFHRIDGAGYALLTSQIRELNVINPQVGARILSPLTKWRRFDDPRRGLMQQQLEQLSRLTPLSKDLFEVISKSLG